MEMVPLPSSRERQRWSQSRIIIHKGPAVSDPLLADEGLIRSRRARPAFGDSYNLPLAVNSTYQPPEPVGLDTETKHDQSNLFDDYLFFDTPQSKPRRRRHALHHHENPAVDMANCFSHGCCCMQCVRTQEIGIIENFGRFQEIVAPGLYCLPWPLTSITGRLSLRVQQIDVVCETKTKDNVFVNVQVSVQFRVLVEKSFDAYYRLSDPGIQIRSYAFDVIRSTVPRMTVDEAFVSKSNIAETIMERLFAVMRDYGYEILSALVTNLMPDEKVKASMNEIEVFKRLKEALPHRAEAGECKVIGSWFCRSTETLLAQNLRRTFNTEKIKIIKKAEASAEAMYLAGVGVAKARMALARGMKESISKLAADEQVVSPQEVIHLLLVNQYLDTLAAVKPDEVIVRATPIEVFDMHASLPK